MIIGSISGGLVFVARFSQKNLLRSLWKALINKMTIIGVDENILDINLLPYTDLFAYLEDNVSFIIETHKKRFYKFIHDIFKLIRPIS